MLSVQGEGGGHCLNSGKNEEQWKKGPISISPPREWGEKISFSCEGGGWSAKERERKGEKKSAHRVLGEEDCWPLRRGGSMANEREKDSRILEAVVVGGKTTPLPKGGERENNVKKKIPGTKAFLG